MFPPVSEADEDGLVAVGGDLHPETLRCAYRSGIFPWPVEGYPLLWFAPPQRAVLRFANLHVARRLRRQLAAQRFELRVDHDFAAVIRACASVPRADAGTWITPAMERAYLRLHRLGQAHSVEAYQNGTLVGGLYGVAFGGYFCGESMFHHASGASKAALLHLVQFLQQQGVTWLDVQMTTPLFSAFGACEVPRQQFMEMLREALHRNVVLFS